MGDVFAALAEEAVHECGLAVVDVGDDSHVAEAAGVQRAAGSRGGRGGRRGGREGAAGVGIGFGSGGGFSGVVVGGGG